LGFPRFPEARETIHHHHAQNACLTNEPPGAFPAATLGRWPYPVNRLTISEMFWPPKPKLLDSARSHFPSRTLLGM